MGDLSGIRFICNKSNNFMISKDSWVYKSNTETSLVRVTQVGLCNSDYSRLFLGSGHKYPITLGHEIVGRVEASDSKTQQLSSKFVCIFPLIPCKTCQECKKDNYNLCSNYSYLGSRQDGGLSSYIEVPNWNIMEINKQIDSTFLPMIEPISVICHSFRSLPANRSSLLITGSGFLSYLALKVGRFLGFKEIRVISTSKSNGTLFEDLFLNSSELSSAAFDSCIDLSGNVEVISEVTRLLLPKSKIVTLANVRSDTYLNAESRERIVRKELSYQGSWNSSYGFSQDDWTMAIDFLSSRPSINFPLVEILLKELPVFLESLSRRSPKERIHVRCSY